MSLHNHIRYVWQGIEFLSLQVCPDLVVLFLDDVEIQVVLVAVQEAMDYVSDVG